jgi:predicted RNase H-like HicB family nuclease/DNA-binding XRE family transcriptional regulator
MSSDLQEASAKTLGSTVKSARLALDLTQSELADRLIVSKRTIEDWERGNQAPAYLRLALDMLGVQLAVERQTVVALPIRLRKLCARVTALNHTQVYTAMIQGAQGGYVVSFPDLPGCLAKGVTVEEARENAKPAIRDWMSAMMAGSGVPPKPRPMGDLIMDPEYQGAVAGGAMFAPISVDLSED